MDFDDIKEILSNLASNDDRQVKKTIPCPKEFYERFVELHELAKQADLLKRDINWKREKLWHDIEKELETYGENLRFNLEDKSIEYLENDNDIRKRRKAASGEPTTRADRAKRLKLLKRKDGTSAVKIGSADDDDPFVS